MTFEWLVYDDSNLILACGNILNYMVTRSGSDKGKSLRSLKNVLINKIIPYKKVKYIVNTVGTKYSIQTLPDNTIIFEVTRKLPRK